MLCVAGRDMFPKPLEIRFGYAEAGCVRGKEPNHNFALDGGDSASISAYISSMRSRYFFAVCGRLSFNLMFRF